MTPAGVLVGKALDSKTGKPIRNFVVQITFSPKRRPDEPSPGLRSDLLNPGQSFQSAEGRFKVENLVVDMPLQVTVVAEGYERQVNQRMVVARPSEAQEEEFRLESIDPTSLQKLRGRMVDPEAKPIAGVQLRLIAAGPRKGERRDSYPFNWTMITTGQIAQDSQVKRFLKATTDRKGEFAFDRVPKGMEMELAWWGKGVAPGRLDHIEKLDRKEEDLVELVLPPPAKVIGTIDRNFYGKAGRIRISSQAGSIDFDDIELKPGQTEYEFVDLPPGAYVVTLTTAYERIPGSNGSMTNRDLTSIKVTLPIGGIERVDFKD